MQKVAVRLNIIFATAIVATALTAPPGMSAPPPTPPEETRRVSAPIEHKLEHAVSVDDAMVEARRFPIPVIGFAFSNPTVTGAFMPSATYSTEKFLRDFAAEHATLPQIDAFLTAPGTFEELQKAKSKRVSVTASRFVAPQPPKEGSKTQQELQNPIKNTTVQVTAAPATSWFPVESEVRTYEQDGNAVLKSSYKWNQAGGSLAHLDSGFGLEVEVYLESDGRIHYPQSTELL